MEDELSHPQDGAGGCLGCSLGLKGPSANHRCSEPTLVPLGFPSLASRPFAPFASREEFPIFIKPTAVATDAPWRAVPGAHRDTQGRGWGVAEALRRPLGDYMRSPHIC